jgi:hypothetical protein
MSIEQVYEQHVKPLEQAEQLRLVEKIVHELAGNGDPVKPARRYRFWREIRGSVQHAMCGEDAQAWVSRNRREDDECREEVLRGT